MSSVVCEDYLLSTTAKILGQVELLNEETVINEIELQIVWFHNKLVYESCSNHYCMKKLSVEEQSGVQKFYCTHCKQYQDEVTDSSRNNSDSGQSTLPAIAVAVAAVLLFFFLFSFSPFSI